MWSSLLRGAYHLYQGFGAGLGNIAMGLVFGYAWQRTGRLWPLVIAHGLIDTVAFADERHGVDQPVRDHKRPEPSGALPGVAEHQAHRDLPSPAPKPW